MGSFNQLAGVTADTSGSCYKQVPSLQGPGPKSKVPTELPVLQPKKSALDITLFCLAPDLSVACQSSPQCPSAPAPSLHPLEGGQSHCIHSMEITVKHPRDKEHYNFARWNLLRDLEVTSVRLSPVRNGQMDGEPHFYSRFHKTKTLQHGQEKTYDHRDKDSEVGAFLIQLSYRDFPRGR